jgi:2-desacetyl-2-hydroxyethyl bacteriochlorophyllide A dehydrogenase
MADTCRAAVFLGDQTYEIREFAVPDPPPGGAVLQVEAVGLCGSDVAQFEGIEIVPGACAFPVVPGHETVGRVVKLAPDAALGVAEGDRVAVNEILFVPGVPLRLYGYSDMTGDGEVGLWGGYGEYMEIFPGTELFTMSDALPAEQLTLFEPLASAVNWVDIVGVHEGDTVVVQGPGHQGLAVLEAALAKKPRQVIVTGTSQDALRLAAATTIGASATVMVDVDDARTVVDDLTRGMGADVVFDVATATQTVPQAIDLARGGGRILLAGLKHFAEIPGLVTDHIVLKSLQLFGGAGFTPASMAAAVALIESGAVRADVVAGEVFDLDRIDEAMALLTRSDPGRDAVRVGIRHTHGAGAA